VAVRGLLSQLEGGVCMNMLGMTLSALSPQLESQVGWSCRVQSMIGSKGAGLGIRLPVF